jgi:hypothetical protein
LKSNYVDWHQTNVTYLKLSNEVVEKLNAPIVNDEIRRDIFNMNPWKAPSLDGFPTGFFQKSWNIVGQQVCNFVHAVWLNPGKISEVNQADICLIPKIQHPS